jgi:hypothetical protein
MNIIIRTTSYIKYEQQNPESSGVFQDLMSFRTICMRITQQVLIIVAGGLAGLNLSN